MAYLFLALGIMTEIFGTTMLKLSSGFTKPLPVVGGVLGFGFALYFLALSFKTIPLGIAYATWAGVGTAGAVIIGIIVWKEKVNVIGVIGIVLIIVGILLVNMTASVEESSKIKSYEQSI